MEVFAVCIVWSGHLKLIIACTCWAGAAASGAAVPLRSTFQRYLQCPASLQFTQTCRYDAAKQQVLRSGITGGDNVWAHALSSACSGFVASGT